MRETTIIPFKARHALAMTYAPHLKRSPKDPGFKDSMERHERAGNVYTCFCDDRVIWIGGITILWPGTGEAWINVCAKVQEYGRETWFTAKEMLGKTMANNNLVHVQAHCRTSEKVTGRFMRKLGFKHEATLKRFGPGGEDYDIYAIVGSDDG